MSPRATLTLLLAAGCGANDTGGEVGGGGAPPLRPGATTAPAGATILAADLAGNEEVPGPGAVDGATAAHVHTGAKGVAGPVVITLVTPKEGRASGCATADPAVVSKVVADPATAYVNVHTAAQPAGAVRGQLTKA